LVVPLGYNRVEVTIDSSPDKRIVACAIRGAFQGTLVRKYGRACLIVPQELAKPVEETIVRYGGEIRSAVPVVIIKKEVEEMAR
jgi:hypothetical protein